MYKIFIAGNHDVCMLDATIEGLPQNVYLLNNTGVTIEGVKIYGVSMFAVFDGEELKEVEHYEQIPDNTDILINHRPWIASTTTYTMAVPSYWTRFPI